VCRIIIVSGFCFAQQRHTQHTNIHTAYIHTHTMAHVKSSANDKADYYEENSHVRISKTLGGLATFNMNHGFMEAMVRGFRSGNVYVCVCAYVS